MYDTLNDFAKEHIDGYEEDTEIRLKLNKSNQKLEYMKTVKDNYKGISKFIMDKILR